MASTMKHMIKNSDAGLLIISMKVLAVNMANRTPIYEKDDEYSDHDVSFFYGALLKFR